MMGFKNIFGVPRHRVFDYKPIYFDDIEENAKKEIRKKMLFEGLTEDEVEQEMRRLKLKAQFNRRRELKGSSIDNNYGTRNRENKNMTSRVLIIILILSLISWFILK